MYHVGIAYDEKEVYMATVSFDEKVVVTDPNMVAKMREDLSNMSPTTQMRNTTAPSLTLEQMEENAKEWMRVLKQSR